MMMNAAVEGEATEFNSTANVEGGSEKLKTEGANVKLAESLKENDEETTSSADWLSMGTSWGSSWLKSAKEKTTSAYELVKRDLNEFSEVVQDEASALMTATATTVKRQAANIGHFVSPNDTTDDSLKREVQNPDFSTQNQEISQFADVGHSTKESGMGKWVKSLLDTVKKFGDEGDTTAGEHDFEVPITGNWKMSGSSSNDRLFALQSDMGTFRREPEGAPELFDDWLDQFSMDDKKEQILHLLANCPPLRSIYSQLVPSEMSNKMFWERYFYKEHQFELDEKRRQQLLNRQHSELTVSTSWGDADFAIPDGSTSEPDPLVTVQPISANDCDNKIQKTEGCEMDEKIVGLSSPDRQSSSNSAESWSVCSAKDILEPASSTPVPQGQLTPTNDKKDSKTDDWIEWDED